MTKGRLNCMTNLQAEKDLNPHSDVLLRQLITLSESIPELKKFPLFWSLQKVAHFFREVSRNIEYHNLNAVKAKLEGMSPKICGGNWIGSLDGAIAEETKKWMDRQNKKGRDTYDGGNLLHLIKAFRDLVRNKPLFGRFCF